MFFCCLVLLLSKHTFLEWSFTYRVSHMHFSTYSQSPSESNCPPTRSGSGWHSDWTHHPVHIAPCLESVHHQGKEVFVTCILIVTSVQSLSCVWFFVTQWNAAHPGFPVHHQLPELAQVHIHWVSDAIQPSHPLSSPSPSAFDHSKHQVLFQWVSSSHQVGLRKWTITINKASGGDGIPVELFQILKDDAAKVLHSICQQIWKTQQWPQDWKSSVLIPIPKKGNAKDCSNYLTIALISHASKLILKILQARLQQYVNQEVPNVRAGFRTGKGIRDQITNIHWIIEKAREIQKNIYLCFIDYVKAFDCVDKITCM